MSKKFTLQDLMNAATGPNVDGPYYELIGRFIVSFAGAESITHELVRKLSGLNDAKARVLFGGMRLGDITTRIRALLKTGNPRSAPTLKDVEACLAQLDVIGLQRDKLVHRHLHYHHGAVHVHNQMTAKSALSFEQDRFDMNDLLRLQLDCLTIILRLTHIVYPAFKKAAIKLELKALHEPWHYKSRAPQTQTISKGMLKIAEALQRRPRPFQK